MPRHPARRRAGAVLRRTFASMSVPNFRWFFAGQLITVWGSYMGSFALFWLLTRITGSGLWVSVAAAAWGAPVLLVGAWAGTLADRLPRRRILLVTQGAWLVNQSVIWAVVAAGVVEPWLICAAISTAGVLNAFDMPARSGFLRDLVGPAHVANAVALRSLIGMTCSIVGPATAGLAIAAWGVAPTLALHVLCGLGLPLALLAIDPAALHRSPPAARRDTRLRVVLREIAGRPQLLIPLLTMTMVGTLSLNSAVLLPLLAASIDASPRTQATLSMALGVGSVAGASVAGAISRAGHRLIAGSAVSIGVAQVAIAPSGSRRGTIVGLVCVGALVAIFAAAVQARLLIGAAEGMHGRVMALYGVAMVGSTTIGAPIIGWLIDAWSTTAALAVSGAVAVLAGGVAWIAGRRVEGGAASSSDR